MGESLLAINGFDEIWIWRRTKHLAFLQFASAYFSGSILFMYMQLYSSSASEPVSKGLSYSLSYSKLPLRKGLQRYAAVLPAKVSNASTKLEFTSMGGS